MSGLFCLFFILTFEALLTPMFADSSCRIDLKNLGINPLSSDETLALGLLSRRLRSEIRAPWEQQMLEKTALSIVQRLKARLELHGLKASEVNQELSSLLYNAEDELVTRFKKLVLELRKLGI